jgi:hypothetical protein
MGTTVRWVVVLLGLAVVGAVVARMLRTSGRQAPIAPPVPRDRDRMLDEESDESFPASDPPSHWAGEPD